MFFKHDIAYSITIKHTQKTGLFSFCVIFIQPIRGQGGALDRTALSRVDGELGTAWRIINSPLRINAPNLQVRQCAPDRTTLIRLDLSKLTGLPVNTVLSTVVGLISLKCPIKYSLRSQQAA
jgi:hypothetical protein